MKCTGEFSPTLYSDENLKHTFKNIFFYVDYFKDPWKPQENFWFPSVHIILRQNNTSVALQGEEQHPDLTLSRGFSWLDCLTSKCKIRHVVEWRDFSLLMVLNHCSFTKSFSLQLWPKSRGEPVKKLERRHRGMPPISNDSWISHLRHPGICRTSKLLQCPTQLTGIAGHEGCGSEERIQDSHQAGLGSWSHVLPSLLHGYSNYKLKSLISDLILWCCEILLRVS